MFTQKRNLMFILAALIIALAVAAGPQLASSAQPRGAPVQARADGVTVPYWGELNRDSGQPAADGSYDFQFSIYAADTGGEALWSEAQSAVSVSGGRFGLALGAATPIPPEILERSPLWLEIAVRGSGESEFSTLLPRQSLSLADLEAPASPAADAACAHDHIGEAWVGAVAWANATFKVTNSLNGPSIWGVNTGGGNAVRGDGYFNSIGVYGEGDTAPGVVGNAANSDGVRGGSSGDFTYGVYGSHGGANYGHGVYGTSDYGHGVEGLDGGAYPDDSYAVYATGDLFVTDDATVSDGLTVYGYATFGGGKSGYVVDVAQNDDTAALEPGDVVVISGAGEAVIGEIPVIKVRRAGAGEIAAVIGVVDKRYVPAVKTPLAPGQIENKTEALIEEGAVQPGEYLMVVTLGAYKLIKVDASFGAILPGSLLVASPNPGYAMLAADPKPGTIIGKALGSLASGLGVVPVVITLQ